MVKTPMAVQNTRRAPKRSAIQPLIGMNTARLIRYEVIATLSRSGLSPMLSAICGIDVAMMVELSWFMNMPQAITIGTVRLTGGSGLATLMACGGASSASVIEPHS